VIEVSEATLFDIEGGLSIFIILLWCLPFPFRAGAYFCFVVIFSESLKTRKMIHEHQKSESLSRELIMITDKEVKGCNPIWLEIEFEDDHPRLKTTQTHQWRERERP